MNIVFASSEVHPFAKTGGLADVCGALPVELAKRGHRPWVFLPGFRSVYQAGVPIEQIGFELAIPVGSKIVKGSLAKTHLPGSNVEVFIVQQPEYYDRAELYREAGADYPDNCERFVFFCRAIMESIRLLNLQVDIIHANDWQTGLLAAYLDLEYRHAQGYEKIGSLLTIHNLAYQGVFWNWDMLLTGLDWKYFNWNQMEFYNKLNLLKTGIVFSHSINTVSKRYAQEIQTPEHGAGLDGVLRHRSDRLSGIINGVDYSQWDPAHDSFLAAKYTAENWQENKPKCRQAMRAELGLPESTAPVIGLVGRLADQKGWRLILEVMQSWLPRTDVQWAVLGTGEPEYHQALSDLRAQYPHKLGLSLAFSNKLAHQIEAGSDIFLMPSQYEPCGLNQLYSLKYGSVPVVRETGGLADTIVDTNSETLSNGTANGFSFADFTVEALQATLRRTLDVYCQQPDQWAKIVSNGMKQDWSWGNSARQYEELYEKTLERRREMYGD